MRKRLILCLLAVTAIFLYTGCGSGLFDRRIKEGVIEFKVTYPELDPDDMLAGLMPDGMTMKFKDNVFNSELSAGMGMFKTNFISNSNEMTLTNSVKLINKKYASTMDKDGVAKMNEKFKKVSVIEMDETKEIAGYKCKKALVVFDELKAGDVYVYYTNEIRFDDPNWSTPFAGIDGVLLEYQMEKFDIKMNFEATKVTEQEIDDAEFTVPGDYEQLTQEELDAEIRSIFETFQ